MIIENSKVTVKINEAQWQEYLEDAGNEVDARGRVLSDAVQQIDYEKEAKWLAERKGFIDSKLSSYSKLHGVYSDKALQNSVQVDFIANERAQQLAMNDFLIRGLNVSEQELSALHNRAQRLTKRKVSIYQSRSLPELQLAYALKYVGYLKSNLDKNVVIRDFFKKMYGPQEERNGTPFFKGSITEEKIAQVCMGFISDAEQKWYPASKMLKLAFSEELKDIEGRLEFIGRGPVLDVTNKQPEVEY